MEVPKRVYLPEIAEATGLPLSTVLTHADRGILKTRQVPNTRKRFVLEDDFRAYVIGEPCKIASVS